jgi:hypothetical protein
VKWKWLARLMVKRESDEKWETEVVLYLTEEGLEPCGAAKRADCRCECFLVPACPGAAMAAMTASAKAPSPPHATLSLRYRHALHACCSLSRRKGSLCRLVRRVRQWQQTHVMLWSREQSAQSGDVLLVCSRNTTSRRSSPMPDFSRSNRVNQGGIASATAHRCSQELQTQHLERRHRAKSRSTEIWFASSAHARGIASGEHLTSAATALRSASRC